MSPNNWWASNLLSATAAWLQKYEEVKAEVVRAERHLLRSFGFIVHVEQPHRFVLSYAHVSGLRCRLRTARCAGCMLPRGRTAGTCPVHLRWCCRLASMVGGVMMKCGPMLTERATPRRPLCAAAGLATGARAGGVEHRQRQPAHHAVCALQGGGGGLRHPLPRGAAAQGGCCPKQGRCDFVGAGQGCSTGEEVLWGACV